MADLAVVACFFSGGVHLQITPHHLEESRFFGTLFLLDGVLFIAFASWLSIRTSPSAWRAAGSLSVLTSLAYFASRTIGIPGMHAETWDLLGLTTTAAQVAVAGVAAGMIGIRRLGSLEIARPRLVAGAAVLVLAAGTVYALTPALLPDRMGNVDGHGEGALEESVADRSLVEMETDGLVGNGVIRTR